MFMILKYKYTNAIVHQTFHKGCAKTANHAQIIVSTHSKIQYLSK